MSSLNDLLSSTYDPYNDVTSNPLRAPPLNCSSQVWQWLPWSGTIGTIEHKMRLYNSKIAHGFMNIVLLGEAEIDRLVKM